MIFLESPWPILMVGIAVEAVLAIALLVTRRGMLLWWLLGTAGFVLLGLLVEWLVVTDREAIDDALHDCAAAVEANDVNRLLAHISPSAAPVRVDIRTVLERVEVLMARITDLEITVNRRSDPRVAKAVFNAIGKGRDRKGEFPTEPYSCKVIVNLRREGNRWLVAEYGFEDLKLP